ncbi:MAG: cupin domain-containing protein [Rhodobacteraceae bacterium]|nr:cupin domain-containing protein [Paracoccaceae bacterium]
MMRSRSSQRLGEPGALSSLRHRHEREDESVIAGAGGSVAIRDAGTVLRPGDAAWSAARPVGHCLGNPSGAEATYLVVGTRSMADVVHCPDFGLTLTITDRRRRIFRHAEGRILAVAEG